MLTPEQYISKPHVDEEIERQQFSGVELLKRGTTVLYSGQKASSPLLAKQTKENHKKNSSQAASLNSIQRGNSRYAMEGPLTTNTSTYPRNKRSLTFNDRIRTSKLKKEEQEPSVPVESASPTPKESVRGSSNNSYYSLTLESKEPSDLVKIPQKSTSISRSNDVKQPLVKLKICPGSDNSKQDSDVIPGLSVEHSTRSYVTPEKLNKTPSHWKNNILNAKRAEDDDRFTLTATSSTTGFDLNNRLSGDEMNSSARTHVYYRKTNSRKQQSNLSSEKKIGILCHDTADQREEKTSKFGHHEHRGQLVNTSVVGKSLSSQRKEKKVCFSATHTRKQPLSMSIKRVCPEDDSSDSRGPSVISPTKKLKGNLNAL